MVSQRSRVGPRQGQHQIDFRLIARIGFGDGVNAYAHSMGWFNGHLYVATTLCNFPLMKRRLPIAMDVWPVECPENPFDMGVIATPARAAQDVANLFVSCGIRGILNFAPRKLAVPVGIALRTVDMAVEFESLSFELSRERTTRRRRTRG